MKRKVNLVGQNTLTVSLPSEWVKKYGIKKGDEINMSEEGRLISLVPVGASKEVKERNIEFKNIDKRFIRLTLNNLYRIGVDKLYIKFDSIKQFEYIQELTNTLFLGFEVTKKGKDYCVLENITEPHGEKYDILLRRIFLIIKESLSLVEEDFKNKEHNLFLVLTQQCNKIEQFINFCMRNTNKENPPNESSISYHFLYDLLIMQRELYHMYEFIDKNKDVKIPAELINLVNKIEKVFDNFYDCFFKKDFYMLANLNHDAQNLLYKDVYLLLISMKGKEIVIVHHLAVLIRFITLIISPTLGII